MSLGMQSVRSHTVELFPFFFFFGWLRFMSLCIFIELFFLSLLAFSCPRVFNSFSTFAPSTLVLLC